MALAQRTIKKLYHFLFLNLQDFRCNLDVTSLFMNISCDMVLNRFYHRFSSVNSKSKISFMDILRATEFLFGNNSFSFNGNYYRQIFGTPMGSPISSFITNLVMKDFENDCLQRLKNITIMHLYYIFDRSATRFHTLEKT